MNSEELLLAMNDLSDELVAEAALPKAKHKIARLHLRWKPLVAACLIMAMLTLTVYAEVDNGYISNLFAPLYGYAQTDIVNKIGQPVGASATVGDYVLTAEAVIGDKYNLAIVYSLTKQNGEVLEEDLLFSTHYNSLHKNGGASYSYVYSEDRTKLSIIEKWTGTDDLMWRRKANVSLSNLVITDRENGTNLRTVQEGSWDLQFTLRYEDTSKEVEIKPFSAVDTDGISYQIEKILISPVGIHIDMNVPNPHVNDVQAGRQFPNFNVSMVLSSGDVIVIENRLFSYGGTLKNARLDAEYSALLEIPIMLSDVQEIIICDITISVVDKL